jgi:quercetin dioxygenase-like cupin family protein
LRPRFRSRSAVAVALLAAVALGALLSQALGNGNAEKAPTAIRNALAQTSRVQGAPGRTLILSRVVVQPGAKLATHRHLGSQVARVQSGSLRYTVKRGAVIVRRGESDGNPRVVRRIRAGQTGTLHSGEWIVEQPSDIHNAANRTSKPVVIYLATLLKKGAPAATPVPQPQP